MPAFGPESNASTPGRRGTAQARSSKATDRIDARLPAETKRMIETAAALVGVTTSDFTVSKAYEAARSVISDHERWILTGEQSRAFVESLLDPPEPNEALKAAAERFKSHSRV